MQLNAANYTQLLHYSFLQGLLEGNNTTCFSNQKCSSGNSAAENFSCKIQKMLQFYENYKNRIEQSHTHLKFICMHENNEQT